MTSATIVRADWSGVTLGEYDSLAILRREDARELVESYWTRLFQDRIAIEQSAGMPTADDQPCRFSPDGIAWLRRLQDELTSCDEHSHIAAARDFSYRMGMLAVSNVARMMRAECGA